MGYAALKRDVSHDTEVLSREPRNFCPGLRSRRLSLKDRNGRRGKMKIRTMWLTGPLTLLLVSMFPGYLRGNTSEAAKQALDKLLLGKEVKALIQLPATKEGLSVYLRPAGNKRLDERGVDLGALSKWLKSRGVGVDANEWETITDVKFDKDRVELHLGGGEGRRGSKHAAKGTPGYKRAGGSRVNFRVARERTD